MTRDLSSIVGENRRLLENIARVMGLFPPMRDQETGDGFTLAAAFKSVETMMFATISILAC